MTTWVALLRAVNVGGRRAVAMEDLRALLADMGFPDSRSLLQSGNLVFRCATRKAAQLERTLEREATSRLAMDTVFFLRSAAEWAALVAGNPFAEEARRNPGRLVVVFLKTAPAPADVKALQAAIRGTEMIRASGKHLYVTYPDGIGRSTLTGGVIEKVLRTRGTARNWRTVVKLHAASAPADSSIARKRRQTA